MSTQLSAESVITIHGWSERGKSLTACGLSWIYGRHSRGKEQLGMVEGFTAIGVTCKRCLKSRNLRRDDEEQGGV